YRIKILTDEGKQYANIEVPHEEEVKIEDIRARTVRPDGTTVSFQGPVFDKVIATIKKLRLQAKTFTLPDVHRGGIIEYSYTVQGRKHPRDLLSDLHKHIRVS